MNEVLQGYDEMGTGPKMTPNHNGAALTRLTWVYFGPRHKETGQVSSLMTVVRS